MGESHDRKKYTAKDHPLAREKHLRTMQDHPVRSQLRADRAYDSQLRNLANGEPASSDKDKAGIVNSGLSKISDARILGLQIDATKGSAAQRKARADTEFVDSFVNFIMGTGRPDEYARCGMISLAKRAEKLRCNGYEGADAIDTLGVISDHPSIRRYIDKKIDRVVRFNAEIQKRKLRAGRAGPYGRPLTLNEGWEAYKFLAHGLDPQGPAGEGNPEDPDMEGPPLEPEDEEELADDDTLKRLQAEWARGYQGPPADADRPGVPTKRQVNERLGAKEVRFPRQPEPAQPVAADGDAEAEEELEAEVEEAEEEVAALRPPRAGDREPIEKDRPKSPSHVSPRLAPPSTPGQPASPGSADTSALAATPKSSPAGPPPLPPGGGPAPPKTPLPNLEGLAREEKEQEIVQWAKSLTAEDLRQLSPEDRTNITRLRKSARSTKGKPPLRLGQGAFEA